MKTVKIFGKLYTPDGLPASHLTGVAILNQYTVDDNRLIVPMTTEFKTDEDGSFEIDLWPNSRGSKFSRYIVKVSTYEDTILDVVIRVPDSNTPININDIVIQSPYPPVNQSLEALIKVQEAALKAINAKVEVGELRDEILSLAISADESSELSKDWAIKLDGLVDDEDYSSKHYANESKRYSDNTETSAEDAEQSASRAKASEIASGLSEDNAKTSEVNAKASENASKLSETNAAESENNAKTSEIASEASATSASESADVSRTHATISTDASIAANNSANEAKDFSEASQTSAVNAKASEDSASASAQTATTKASEASQSAEDSATSAQESNLSAEASETSNQSAIAQATIATEAKDEVIVMRDEVISLEQSSEDSANLSKDWAVKINGLVNEEDYSAKYYAGKSEESRQGSLDASVLAAQQATDSSTSAIESQLSADLSHDWAVKLNDTVDGVEFSAKHYAQIASQESQSAKDSMNVAITSADNASSSATTATNAATSAEQSAQEAADSAASMMDTSVIPLPNRIPKSNSDGLLDDGWLNLAPLRVQVLNALYPNGIYPSLDLRFVGANMINNPNVNFERSSKATYWDKYGVLREADIDEPRFTYDPMTGEALGLLLEPFTSTNLLVNSGDFSQWVSSDDGKIVGQLDSRGGHNAVTYFGGFGINHIAQYAVTSESGQHTATIIVKPVEGKNTNAVFMIRNATEGINFAQFTVDLSEGTTTHSNATVTPQPNGFWKITWTTREQDTITAGDNLRFYAGNVSPIASNTDFGITLDYAQLEPGTKATSYIPTGDSQVTRAGDRFTLPLGDWYRPDQGTLLVDAVVLTKAHQGGNVAALRESNYSRITLPNVFPSNTRRTVNVTIDGVANTVYTTALLPNAEFGERLVSAISWDGSGFVYSDSGIVSDTEVSPDGYPNPTELRLFTQFGGGWTSIRDTPSGIIRSIAYYPRRLTDAQLAALTTITTLTEVTE